MFFASMSKTVTALSILIVICFAGSLSIGAAECAAVDQLLGLHAAAILRGWFWTFITYQFLHGGWPHVLLNLATLVSVGPDVERAIGSWRFLLLYFVSGVIGAGVWLAFVWPEDQILIGASASICGLLGALAALRSREKYSLIIFPFPLPAWLLISVLAATQVAYFLLKPDSNIAYLAHLAGGLAGFFVARVLRRRDGISDQN
jgi:membrane associated rhomboid family serine protease